MNGHDRDELRELVKEAVADAMRVWARRALIGWLLLALAVAVLYTSFKGEQGERIDQNCRLFEADHKQDVDNLRSTYAYLVAARDRPDTIYRFVLAGLPRQEQEARVDSAPDYCDEPGAKAEGRGESPVGLPEPDPVVPQRPKSLGG